MEWFHDVHGQKTKLDWFLFEIALEYYDCIKKNMDLASYREKYNEEQIAQYCTYYSRRMKDNFIKNFKGRTKNIMIYGEYIGDYYPHHTTEENTRLQDVAMEAIESILQVCASCPQDCQQDYDSMSVFFDQYKD